MWIDIVGIGYIGVEFSDVCIVFESDVSVFFCKLVIYLFGMVLYMDFYCFCVSD